jgi:hypothetical protein
MSLTTCPYCGTIFATRDMGCPTCTYRLPAEQIPPDRLHPGAAAVDRATRWLRRVNWKMHEVLPHKREDEGGG